MNKRLRCAVLVAVFVVAVFPIVANADMGFGLSRSLNIEVRFENLDDYPAYDFYLKYGMGPGNPGASPHLTRLTSGTTTLLEGKGNRMTAVYLLAVPHGQDVPRPVSIGNGIEWLNEVPAGAFQSLALPGNSDQEYLGAESDAKTVSYRVSIEGNRIDIERLRVDASGNATEEKPRIWFWLGTCVGGVALSLALTLGVLVWLLSRGRRAAQP